MLLRSGRVTTLPGGPHRRGGRVKRKAAADADPSSPKVPDACDDDAAVAELGIKRFPSLRRDQASALWVGFVNDARTCIKHYNINHKATFVYKHEPSNGFYSMEELDGEMYYHMNFLAQDEDGNSQRFFGEIRTHVSPRVEDVTCCRPVTPSDAGGIGIRTIEEAAEYEYAKDFKTVGYDLEHCYACTSRVKHPKGTYYVAGHFADVRQYYGALF